MSNKFEQVQSSRQEDALEGERLGNLRPYKKDVFSHSQILIPLQT